MYALVCSLLVYFLLNLATSTLAIMFANGCGEKQPLGHFMPDVHNLYLFAAMSFIAIKVTHCHINF